MRVRSVAALPSPRPPAPPLGPARRRAARRGRSLSGARARRAPPRPQRAPRGEEAAAAGWGHFVSAIAVPETRWRRRPSEGPAVAGTRRSQRLRVSLSLPLLVPILIAPRRSPLLFLGCRESRATPGRGAGQILGEGLLPEGPGWSSAAGTTLPCSAPLPSPFFPPLPLSPLLGRWLEPCFFPRAFQRREGPSAASRHGE